MSEHPSELQQIRRAFLQAAEEEYKAALDAVPAAPPFSAKYRRWEKKFLRNPFSVLKAAARPQWQRVLRSVACFLVVLSVVFGSIMVACPTARAAVIRWVTREAEDHIAYDFEGHASLDQMGRWEISDLPEGYEEQEYIDLANMVCVIYSNGDPDMDIDFRYQLLRTGGGENLDNEWHTISNISVLGMPGKLYTSTEKGGLNMLVWFDEENEHSFVITSRLDCDVLLNMAESAKLTK